jgi:hypothetical protein
MCTVSAVGDWGMRQWPLPNYGQQQYIVLTKEQWEEYQELKRMAVKIDNKTGQPDCVKPEFDEWEKKMIDLLKKQGILK